MVLASFALPHAGIDLPRASAQIVAAIVAQPSGNPAVCFLASNPPYCSAGVNLKTSIRATPSPADLIVIFDIVGPTGEADQVGSQIYYGVGNTPVSVDVKYLPPPVLGRYEIFATVFCISPGCDGESESGTNFSVRF